MLRPMRARPATAALAATTLILTSLTTLAATAPAVAASETVYDSIPATLDGNYPSVGFQARSTDEFGDIVSLGGSARALTTATVVFSSWACETGSGASCVSTTDSSYTHPITLNVYTVDRSGAVAAPGTLIASVTENKTIPYRPSADATCADGRWKDSGGTCFSGFAFPLSWDLSSLGVYAPDEVAVTIAFNTNTHGASPLGASGPYESLNVVAFNATPTAGSENQDEVLQDSTWTGAYTDGGAGGLDTLRLDNGWTGNGGMLMELAADDATVPTPTQQVTVRHVDVKPSETAETYTSWHEGKNNPSPRYRVGADGLHLGIGGGSTIIKGTAVATDAASVKVTENELRRLITGIASATVVSGTPTFQVPVHYGSGSPSGFTTLLVPMTTGVNSFATSQTWMTSRALGSYPAFGQDTLSALLSKLYSLGGDVWLAGFGVQADSEAVVSRVAWGDTVYTFKQPVVGTCSTVASGPIATNQNANGWDFSQTRTAGSNTFVHDGIRVTTTAATSLGKAAGYHAIDIALSAVGTPAMSYTLHSGVAPSIQLGVDLDHDGTLDGYLVREDVYAAGMWWASNGIQTGGFTGLPTVGGGGSGINGTLDDYLLAYPDARVLSYGYSLGSGVLGDATIASITVGCAASTFDFAYSFDPEVERIYGPDRYTAAIGYSQKFAPGVDRVYLASGEKFPDALSGGPAAASMGSPVLLTEASQVLPSVITELTRLHPAEIVVLGGTGTLAASIDAQLEALPFHPDVIRMAGADRFEVSRMVTAEAFSSADVVYISTGYNFPDALAAGPAAATVSAPVLLVDGGANKLDAATLALIAALGPTKVKIAGGPGSVSPGIQTQLASLYTVKRLGGADRFEAAVTINNDAFTSSEPLAYIATGLKFPDALAGGPLAAKSGAPLYVANETCVPGSVLDSLVAHEVEKVVLLGGPGSLTAAVANLVRC